jgi:DNA-directed RNA polymerase specialized sigma24 family protein
MDIDKDKLTELYAEGDMENFFKEAGRISSFLIMHNFKIYDKDRVEDMTQECLENLWKKIVQGKVDGSKNLFAFIWRNSSFRILEILRKENNRKKKAQFFEYDEIEKDFSDYVMEGSRLSAMYNSPLVRELSTVI